MCIFSQWLMLLEDEVARISEIDDCLHFKYYFLQSAHSPEQTPLM